MNGAWTNRIHSLSYLHLSSSLHINKIISQMHHPNNGNNIRMGGARRRSQSATRSITDSTVNFMGRIGQSLRITSSSSTRRRQKEDNDDDVVQMQILPPSIGRRQSLAEQWFRTVRLRNKRLEHLKERGGISGIRSEELSRKQFEPISRNNPSIGDEDNELEMFALVPPQLIGNDALANPASPLSTSSSGFGGGSRSCPTTPRPLRRRYLKEGFCQLTSIQTLSHHHRYMFLFDDLLLICKQKGENSYKLKEKVALEYLWLSSNNCTNSFLIGWPITQNYIAHFSSEHEKLDWFEKLSDAIQRRIHSKSTTICIFVQIEGRQQQIRQKVRNSQKANQLIEELCRELHLPILDPHLGHYELCFCTGTTPKRARNPSGLLLGPSEFLDGLTASKTSKTPSGAPSPAILRRVHSHTSIVAPLHQIQPQNTIHPLHGVENVYAVLMEFVRNQLGISLSDSQLAHLDTCPLVNCRLILRQNGPNAQSNASNKNGFNLVNQFRRVLGRAESAASNMAAKAMLIDGTKSSKAQKHLFGRQLRGSMPPQPVLTMIDHLLLYGSDVEGIFRKSPKQQTVRVLRQQLDQGQVPDFHQFNVHVTASLLKDYLRSIPGQLLLSGNYRLWTDAITNEEFSRMDRINQCRKLLALLPPAHTILLRSLLRLLRKIASNEAQTKMNVSALAVCIAPSLMEKLEQVESVRVVPELVIFLVENAPSLFDGFLEDGPLLPGINSMSANSAGQSPLHQSTDSGLSEVGAATTAMGTKRRFLTEKRSISPDSGKLSSEPPSEDDDCRGRRLSPMRWMKTHSLEEDELGGGTFGARYIDLDGENIENIDYDEEKAIDNEKTPVVLSRENSDVKDNTMKAAAALGMPAAKFAWRSAQLNKIEGGNGTAKKQLSRNSAILSPQIGNRKCSTNSSVLDRNLSPTCSATPRKVSAASVDSIGSQTNSGMAALSRRALLATKSEALGLVESTNSRKSSLMSTTSSIGGGGQKGQSAAKLNRKPWTEMRQQIGAKVQLQRTNGTTTNGTLRSPLWTPQPEKRPSPILWQFTTNSFAGSMASSTCPSPSYSEQNSVMNVQPTNLRRFSAGIQSNNLAKNNTEIIHNQLCQNGTESQQRRASSGQMRINENRQQQKYIPPKRTAEELLLDKLEVNWSVPQIRKQFQQSASNAPLIDTLYAKLPAPVGHHQPQKSSPAVGGPK